MIWDILAAAMPLLLLLLMICVGELIMAILPSPLRDKLIDWMLQDRRGKR